MLSYIVCFFFSVAFKSGEVPPPPTPEIKHLVKQLGDRNFIVRENASKNLRNKGYKALQACIDAEQDENPEVASRARWTSEVYYTSACPDDRKYPSIYLLPDMLRFPFGVDYEKDPESTGWCRNMTTPADVAVYYYTIARKTHNDGVPSEDGYEKISNMTWQNDAIEEKACSLFARDLLYHGYDPKRLKKILTGAKENRCLFRNYDADSCSTIPGPAVDKRIVPDEAEHRYWGQGCGPEAKILRNFRGMAGRLFLIPLPMPAP